MSNVQVLGAGRFLQLLCKNGWEFIHRANCNGIAVMAAVTQDQKILFVQQYRPPIDSDSIELPAGLIADGEGNHEESALEAAKRELLEEAGYEAEHWNEVFEGPGGAGASADILHFFIATGARRVSAGGGDPSEKIVVHAVPLRQVDEWLAQKRKQKIPMDPKIYAGLYFLNKYNGAGKTDGL